MSYFPPEFNPRDDVVGVLALAAIEAEDGTHRFMVGTDGRFIDSAGHAWFGSQLLSVGDLELSINGTAPSGALTLSFIQDPDAPDLIAQMREQGVAAIEGRPLTFYQQPLRAMAEFYAPTLAPIPWLTRTMRRLTFDATGAQERSISVEFEAASEYRRTARRRVYNTTDHSQMVGATNPSLSFVPRDNWRSEKMFR
ncbi:hypothetical protein AQS8620_01295 [Aquimixticola soesokkakensis]|uniref:Uncharacterized protein n=1 Tax=Aquimixticola soesokkakensis TaxID=1519096 RepID=A0A1Y5SBY5_9RHOB|nr:hypothetical protein [Aquimixticola soesokkakensis]SLN36482.1 hypothetical protein AQS8620_01295 [Aquimixticola soesokkakensis]